MSRKRSYVRYQPAMAFTNWANEKCGVETWMTKMRDPRLVEIRKALVESPDNQVLTMLLAVRLRQLGEGHWAELILLQAVELPRAATLLRAEEIGTKHLTRWSGTGERDAMRKEVARMVQRSLDLIGKIRFSESFGKIIESENYRSYFRYLVTYRVNDCPSYPLAHAVIEGGWITELRCGRAIIDKHGENLRRDHPGIELEDPEVTVAEARARLAARDEQTLS